MEKKPRNYFEFLFQNETLDDVPQSVIDDCAQLVKANSISGKISFMKMSKSVKCSNSCIKMYKSILKHTAICKLFYDTKCKRF